MKIEVTGDSAAAGDDGTGGNTIARLRMLAAQPSGVRAEVAPGSGQRAAGQPRYPGGERGNGGAGDARRRAPNAAAMRARKARRCWLISRAAPRPWPAHIDAVAARAGAGNYKELLMKRLREAGLELSLDDERVLREIALLRIAAMSSENTRLRSHLGQFDALLPVRADRAQGGVPAAGSAAKVNTIGSKANDVTSRAVIGAKNERRRVRDRY